MREAELTPTIGPDEIMAHLNHKLELTSDLRSEPKPEPMAFPFPTEPADTLTGFEWTNIAVGIALAGGAYPLVLGAMAFAIALAIGFVTMLGRAMSGNPIGIVEFSEIIPSLLLFPASTATCAMIGLIWASFVSALTLPVVYLFAWSLRLRGSTVRFGAFCGALVGFVSVLPILLIGPAFGGPALALLFFGPGLATIVGQVGGAWGGWRAAVCRNEDMLCKSVLSTSGRGLLDPTLYPAKDFAGDGDAEPWIQFRIHHLLWLAVWISLLLTLIRLAGIPFELILPFLGGWIVFQAFTLYLGAFFVETLWPRWRARHWAFHVEHPAN